MFSWGPIRPLTGERHANCLFTITISRLESSSADRGKHKPAQRSHGRWRHLVLVIHAQHGQMYVDTRACSSTFISARLVSVCPPDVEPAAGIWTPQYQRGWTGVSDTLHTCDRCVTPSVPPEGAALKSEQVWKWQSKNCRLFIGLDLTCNISALKRLAEQNLSTPAGRPAPRRRPGVGTARSTRTSIF